jgi:hypothetical protein
MLDEGSARLEPVMISRDSRRDSAHSLGRCLGAFQPNFPRFSAWLRQLLRTGAKDGAMVLDGRTSQFNRVCLPDWPGSLSFGGRPEREVPSTTYDVRITLGVE